MATSKFYDGEMTEEEYLELEQIVCTRKARYDANYARKVARYIRESSDEEVSAYRCPFGGSTKRDEHWHFGHSPSLHHVQRLQLAIRYKSTRVA